MNNHPANKTRCEQCLGDTGAAGIENHGPVLKREEMSLYVGQDTAA